MSGLSGMTDTVSDYDCITSVKARSQNPDLIL